MRYFQPELSANSQFAEVNGTLSAPCWWERFPKSFLQSRSEAVAVLQHQDGLIKRSAMRWSPKRSCAASTRRIWEPWELEFLHVTYPSTSTKELAQRLRRSVAAIYGLAELMGLHKSEQYLSWLRLPVAPWRRRRAGNRFQRGHVPANKGLRRPGWSPGKGPLGGFGRYWLLSGTWWHWSGRLL